jgi:NAD+ diphosphatase
LPPIPASRLNTYAGSPLDRVAARREDAAWVEAARAAPQTLWVPLWRGRGFMRGVAEGRPEAVLLSGTAADSLRATAGAWAFLGMRADAPVFAIDISDADDPLALLEPDAGAFTELRGVAGVLPGKDAAILAHARGLLHWRSRSRFCGVCGHACAPTSAGQVMVCSNCGTHHFPRTDPAVIMLVTRGDRALLGHSQRFPNAAMYSTLAGFVEPGESLEEAVAREVFEEAHVRVGRVFYHSSQPWPFPASIMLGFYAEALTEEITVDVTEMADARWFSREQIRHREALGFAVPPGDSIARRLIEDWMAAE